MQSRNARQKRLSRALPDVHPLISLVALLVFIAGMAQAHPAILALGLAVLGVLFFLFHIPVKPDLVLSLMRLRWLLLAILVVYGWWTPGDPVLPAIAGLSPTVAGLEAGFFRVLALLLIAASVYLLLRITPREQLLAALVKLVSPVSTRAGRERFAVRVLLTIETVVHVQPLMASALKKQGLAPRHLVDAGYLARNLYQSVLEKSGQVVPGAVEIADIGSPAYWQWLIPVSLVVIFLLMG